MSPAVIFGSFIAYTVVIFVIAWFTSRKADNQSYFIGNRKSPWFVVAYGMIGASLSGVTFISIPGWVGDTGFSYFMIVLGYVVGYAVITTVLLPMYYKLNLTTIYSYLNIRFGRSAYKTGSSFFLLSRIIGASFRMFLVITVLQYFVFDHYGVPFAVTAIIFMLLIQLYTLRGGIKTIIWTDMLQTTFMLVSVITTIIIISQHLDFSFVESIKQVWNSEYSRIIIDDVDSKQHYLKLFFSGVFITIVMTGLDQDMMQKNLSCRNLADAQKNMTTLSIVLIPVNIVFLFLGGMLYIYAGKMGIAAPPTTDYVFPNIAFNNLGMVAGIIFIIGLISAAYSSADSALTALTTSFSIDILELDKKHAHNPDILKKKRYLVHILMSVAIILVIILFEIINNQAVIARLFTFAGYTYGPLLGLYAFGLLTKLKARDRLIPYIAILSPIISYGISYFSPILLNGYNIGFEILIVNGLITFAGLYTTRTRN